MSPAVRAESVASPDLPALALALWAGACLRGVASPRDVASAVIGRDQPHAVSGPEQGDSADLESMVRRLQAQGLRGVTLHLPVPGDPSGLAPGHLATAAMSAGQSVSFICGDRFVGLVPEPDLRGSSWRSVRWRVFDATADAHDRFSPTADVAEASHNLARSIREAAADLTDIDAAPWPSASGTDYRPTFNGALSVPPGLQVKAVALLAQASRLHAILATASALPDVTTSASGGRVRSETLRTLDAAVRRALIAAAYTPVSSTQSV